ncbi:hypothetical protein [Actinokineospora iranica]|uniref:Small secreted protein n=1 Tax=Actinokineospora iranica TaxID=1271860 RepID=A0A1G6YTA8_9PSEU|nr:hypothetical protein [Actinokineospora iranica]SDD92776.1 hypothetical protein SAMN05216174_1233 [Actinokineospora iranica]
MMGRLVPALASVLVAAAALAGCSSDSPDTVPPPESPAVGWVEKVCQSVDATSAKTTQFPAFDPTDPAKTKEGLLTLFGTLSEGLTQVGDTITGAGAPPVANGSAVVDKALANIDGAKTSLDSVIKKVEAAPTNDPAAFQAALTELGASTDVFEKYSEGPMKDLRENPEINDAFGKAPTCRKVAGM